jgi:drug/metabolite transporter (DMT)-like permease
VSHSPPPVALPEARYDPLRATLLILITLSLFPVMDSCAKYLVQNGYDFIQVVWARYAFHVAATLVFIVSSRRRLWLRLPRGPGLQLLRALLLMGATGLFFAALRVIDLAEAVAVNFVAPLLVVVFSVVLLGERVGLRRWGAVAVGFVAILIILRPGTGIFQWASLLVVGAAACNALHQLVTRKLSAIDHPMTTLFVSGLVGAVCLSAIVPFHWRDPDLLGWGLMAAIGGIGAVSHYSLIRAFQYAPASMLAPYGYTQIVAATAIGYAVFGNFPDLWTILGALLIIASGLYVAYREAISRRLTRAKERGAAA